ncbi:hypothetical protein SAMN05216604_103121 [Pseudomonas agarici]|nr:hypothetical protein SAMN05216604_103121 [Pseudomonas agarici]
MDNAWQKHITREDSSCDMCSGQLIPDTTLIFSLPEPEPTHR